MIVYNNKLLLKTTFDNVLELFVSWINRINNNPEHKLFKKEDDLTIDDIKNIDCRLMKSNSRLYTASYMEKYPYQYAARFTHGDKTSRGRLWITEIGLKQESENSDLEYTLLLKIEDTDVYADLPILTRPFIDRDIYEKILKESIVPSFKSLEVKSVNDSLAEIENFSRQYTIVILSASQVGYPIDFKSLAEKLKWLFFGLADIWIIPENEDTFQLEELMGIYSVWNGAINVIHPPVRSSNSPDDVFCWCDKLLPAEIDELKDEYGKDEVQKRILSFISRRKTFDIRKNHVSVEGVKERSLSEKINGWLEHTKNEEDKSSIKELAAQVEHCRKEHEELYDLYDKELSDKDKDIQQLRAKLECSETDFEKGLSFIESIYKGKIVFLSSAKESARKSKYNNIPAVLESLIALCTRFYDDWKADKLTPNRLLEGCFGKKKYAPHEGKNLPKNGEKLREFEYDGQLVPMLEHLKFGYKDSSTETLRVHFYLDNNKKLIVIGYCGKHLDR